MICHQIEGLKTKYFLVGNHLRAQKIATWLCRSGKFGYLHPRCLASLKAGSNLQLHHMRGLNSTTCAPTPWTTAIRRRVTKAWEKRSQKKRAQSPDHSIDETTPECSFLMAWPGTSNTNELYAAGDSSVGAHIRQSWQC